MLEFLFIWFLLSIPTTIFLGHLYKFFESKSYAGIGIVVCMITAAPFLTMGILYEKYGPLVDKE